MRRVTDANHRSLKIAVYDLADQRSLINSFMTAAYRDLAKQRYTACPVRLQIPDGMT
jgi:hypothetical protein